MKKAIFVLCLILGFSYEANSQTFNYQAAVRDAGGNLVTNQSVGVRIRILEGSPTGTVLFNETHSVTSNAHGIIALPVGGGTAEAGSTSFGSISWSQLNKWIDIWVDVVGGTNYVQLGTSELRFVPYALYAVNSNQAANAGVFTTTTGVTSNANQNYVTDDFVFGSFQLNANGSYNNAYNNRMFFDKSKAAFRAGYTEGDQWDEAKVGNYSIGFGKNSTAKGENSFAMGSNANAIADYSFAFGQNAGGFETYAIGIGQNARGFGKFSTAIGTNLNANSFGEIQLGQYSTYTTGSKTTFVPADRLFVIGNGQYELNAGLNSDALVMLKNGNTTLNGTFTIDADNKGVGKGYTLPAQDGTTNQIMSTDGSGALSWVTPAAAAIPNGGNAGEVLSTNGSGVLSWANNDILPAGGTDGFVLKTNGSGNYTWVSSDDADADATNEIELPVGGSDGQVLKTDGSGNYAWINQPALPVTVFSTVNNVTSNAPGTIATDSFVFGSTQIDNITGADDNSRMFFSKSGGAFRAGINMDANNGFNIANIGYGSVGFGINNKASGWYSATLGGILNNATGFYSVTAGNTNTASASSSVALGQYNNASGVYSATIGGNLTSESAGQISLGTLNTAVAGNANTYVTTDRLFVIGNGTSDINGITKSDALTILKNGNTTLNGSLTIDGDNQGAGKAYTLPGQDGTANQVMTTDGSGNVSWGTVNAGGLPSQTGQSGKVLSTDGTNTSWVADAVDDADADATNEIELPTGGNSGQVLRTDGSGNYTWVDQTAASTAVFSTTTNVTSNAPGTTATDDFVFGSTQLNAVLGSTNDDARFFFDKSKAAFRAGIIEDTATDKIANKAVPFGQEWNEENIGMNSIAMGKNVLAKGDASISIGATNNVESFQGVAVGHNNSVTGAAGYTLGLGNTISNLFGFSLGINNTVSGKNAVTIGTYNENSVYGQIVLGNYNTSISGNSETAVSTDPLFVIGNGTGFVARSNALVMLKNGNTTLNGSLTIDGDNQGVGKAYTLPAQDGTVNQIMQTNGSGGVTWVNAPSSGTTLPSGGNSGDVLRTDGSGNYTWVSNDDGDASATNEIELPVQTGQSGKFLTTDGTNPSWTGTVEATSVKIPSLPAFNVRPNLVTLGVGTHEVVSWSSTVNTNLFDDGNHFNETTGRFTAPVDGLYYFSAQVRLDLVNTGYSRLMITKNGVLDFNNGLHSIRNSDVANTSWDTQSISGVLKLNAGDYVSVFVTSSSDTSFSVQTESGFNGYLVNKL